MKRLIPFLCLFAASALAAPPYDVDVTVTAPADGGPVDSYTLILDGTTVGPVNVGVNTFAELLPSEGTYVFQVEARNAAGPTLSEPVTVQVSEIDLPGKPTIEVQVSCDPCVLTISP